MLRLLHRASVLAAERGGRAYLVGGNPRDLLLSVPHHDVDVAIEGNALEIAETLASEADAQLETAERFGTANLTLPNALPGLDLVTTRKELYDYPGALPTVQPGTIYDDLARRDFTINAMALELLPQDTGTFLDAHRGLNDLDSRLIRVLHDNSFIDDPTRIFRAVKYAGRLGFNIEPHTLELILRAIRDGAIVTVSADRLTREVLLIMEEPNAPAMLAHLEKLGALRAVNLDLSWPYEADSPTVKLTPPDVEPHDRRDTYLAVLGAEYAGFPDEAEALARSLGLEAPLVRLVRDSARLAAVWPRMREPNLPPSQVYRLLKNLDEAALRAYARLAAVQSDTAAWVRLRDYLERLRFVRPALDGHSLGEMGVEPGPIYRRLLGALLDAKLDGKLPAREDEERFVRDWLEREWRGGKS